MTEMCVRLILVGLKASVSTHLYQTVFHANLILNVTTQMLAPMMRVREADASLHRTEAAPPAIKTQTAPVMETLVPMKSVKTTNA